jgi:hypothetical protein
MPCISDHTPFSPLNTKSPTVHSASPTHETVEVAIYAIVPPIGVNSTTAAINANNRNDSPMESM